MDAPDNHSAWAALEAHYAKVRTTHLRELFANDTGRGERLNAEGAGVFLDYSKNRVTDETLKLLLNLAEASNLRGRIEAMFSGEKINVSENRAVLHVALRAPKGTTILVDGKNVVPEVHEVLDKMSAFADRVRSGAWKGHTGKRIRNVVNVGIGGSDLGPVMAYEALRAYSDRDMTFRFVSNVDGTDFAEAVIDSGRGGDAVRYLLEDVHHARDDDQRARGARLALGQTQERRNRGCEALRRRVDQRGRSFEEVRHRHRQHVRFLGLGRRPLFDGLGDRALDDDRDRPGAFPCRCCSGSTKWTSTFAPRRSPRTCRY